jgi:uncharacterized membrane protein
VLIGSQEIPARLPGLIETYLAAGGVIFSLYLTYLELFVIRAVCIWCLTSAVIITLLMLLSLKPELLAFAPDDGELKNESVAEPG